MCLPLVEIALTDLPKTGGGTKAPPPAPLATALIHTAQQKKRYKLVDKTIDEELSFFIHVSQCRAVINYVGILFGVVELSSPN